MRPKATARFAKKKSRAQGWFRRLLWIVLALVVGFYACCALVLVLLKWVNPFTTAVQTERRIDSLLQHHTYHKRYTFVPMRRISPELQHAVIAAEDARFYQHHGFDWHEIHEAAEEDLDGGRSRGASTLTQQLVKNLLFGTGRSVLRKAVEATLVPVAELVLGKQRILELYLNVVEWGPGVYGAESACRGYYGVGARSVGRQQAARLAAILPAPLKRRPERMTRYSEIILERMRQMGW